MLVSERDSAFVGGFSQGEDSGPKDFRETLMK